VEVTRVCDLARLAGREVVLQGWVYNRTDKGKLCFLLLRDGSGFAQCVAFKGDLSIALFDQIIRLPQESAVRVKGIVREDKRAPGIPGGYEVSIQDLEVDSHAQSVVHLACARNCDGCSTRMARPEWLHRHGHAHPHAGRSRGHYNAF